MTPELLHQIVFCICGQMKPKEQAIDCIEKYVNCAVVQDGKILEHKEFAKRCNFTENQNKCY